MEITEKIEEKRKMIEKSKKRIEKEQQKIKKLTKEIEELESLEIKGLLKEIDMPLNELKQFIKELKGSPSSIPITQDKE